MSGILGLSPSPAPQIATNPLPTVPPVTGPVGATLGGAAAIATDPVHILVGIAIGLVAPNWRWLAIGVAAATLVLEIGISITEHGRLFYTFGQMAMPRALALGAVATALFVVRVMTKRLAEMREPAESAQQSDQRDQDSTRG